MIDYIILCSYRPFAVIMQLHPGWVGFLQTQVLNCLGCLWFNRTEVVHISFLRRSQLSQGFGHGRSVAMVCDLRLPSKGFDPAA